MISKTWLKRAYFSALALCGRDAALLRRIEREDLVVVVNVHQVSPHANPFWNPLHPKTFEELLIYLKRHFVVTGFTDDAPPRRERPRAILSFDDGYFDFVEYAMPLLQKHGIRANQNVIISCVESGLPPWNVRLYDFLKLAPRSVINDIALPGFLHRLTGDDDDSKTRFGLALSRFLKNRPREAREGLWPAIEAVMAKAGVVGGTRMMSVDDVRQAAAVHEIGAHSFSHESMEFESNDFFEEDLDRCFAFFRDRLHLPLTIYAFPNGSHRREQIEMLRGRGIRHILLVDEKFGKAGNFVWPRFTMYGHSGPEVRFRALGYHAAGVLAGERPPAASGGAGSGPEHGAVGGDIIGRGDGEDGGRAGTGSRAMLVITQDRVLEAIFDGIEAVNQVTPTEAQLRKSVDTVLFRESGELDSLRLVNLIVAIEQKLQERFEVSVDLANDGAMSMKDNPFATVASLVEYITALLERKNL